MSFMYSDRKTKINFAFILFSWLLVELSGCDQSSESIQSMVDQPGEGGSLMTGGEVGGDMGGQRGGDLGGSVGGDLGGSMGGSLTASDECVAACDSLVACVESDCMLMSMENQPTPDAIREACLIRCDEFPAFTAASEGIEECSDWITFAQQQITESEVSLSDVCESSDSGQEHHVECEDFGANYARCLIELCPSLEETSDVLIGAYTAVCDEQVNLGNADPQQLYFIANERTSCTSGTLSDLIQVRLEERPLNPESGDLIAACEEGPLTPLELCEQACENFSPCIPDDSEIAFWQNQDRCMDFCLLQDQPTDQTWECLSNTVDCSQQGACFEAIDAPECTSFSSRVTSCIAEETCEAFGEISDGTFELLKVICEAQVGQGILSVSDLAQVDENTSCSNPLVNVYKNYFLTVTPGQDGSGSLETLCEEDGGLINEGEQCLQACQNVGPCIPEGTEGELLRNEDICFFSCRTSPDISGATWTCLSEESECTPALQCF